ncbi:MAG: hypothetical protein NC041_02100 [Bacteroides sp.]|nr:hypothetical protein [Prevotella sp.]MCM1407605.1 hypothetical protein [Treponema brennaborense]MCM1469245.1 hypothetical protein [Bacteroides sp.]
MMTPLIMMSCGSSHTVNSLKMQKLFLLGYGNFEDEVNLFDLSDFGEINLHIAMKDGIFFIANGGIRKVIQMSSYGDLIGICYNPESNPTPSFVSPADASPETSSSLTILKAVAYPFNRLGKIAVDTKKNFYVVDTLPPERQEQDAEHKLALREVVLRFSSDGNFLDYQGQQGSGGTPFPYISGIYTTKNNELVVVSLTNSGSIVYWFSDSGYLKYTVPIENSKLPLPDDEADDDLFVNLGEIIPDYTQQKLYIKTDYHRREYDASLNMQSGVTYVQTLLYPLNVESGKFESPLLVQAYEDVVHDGFGRETYRVPFDFLGVTESGWFFFIVSDASGFTLQMVQPNGQKILNRHLDVKHEETVYHDFSLSSDGIITALIAEQEKASVVWWRTDELISALLKK